MFEYQGKMYEYAEGQRYCHDCGEEFKPTGEAAAAGGHVTVVCPTEGCNPASWADLAEST